MGVIEHHKIVDKALYEDDFSWYEGLIIRSLSKISETNTLGALLKNSLNMVYLSAALEKKEIKAYIDLSTEVLNLMYFFAMDEGNTGELSFSDKKYEVERNEHFDASWSTNYTNQILGIYLAILSKNQDALNRFIDLPFEKLDELSKGLDPFFKSYSLFLTSVLKKEDRASNLLIDTLKLAFPEEIKSADYDFLEANHLTALECWVKLMSKEEIEFQQMFNESLENFKGYWSSNKKLNKGDKHKMQDKTEGYLSIPLSAISQIASDNGLNVELQSPYLYKSAE